MFSQASVCLLTAGGMRALEKSVRQEGMHVYNGHVYVAGDMHGREVRGGGGGSMSEGHS